MSPAKKKTAAQKSSEGKAKARKQEQVDFTEITYSQEFLQSEQAMIEAEKGMAEQVNEENSDQ